MSKKGSPKMRAILFTIANNVVLHDPHFKNIYSKGEDAIILIGPEGDFSPEEVEYALKNGFKEISLGTNRLRTETAGVVVCTMFNLINN